MLHCMRYSYLTIPPSDTTQPRWRIPRIGCALLVLGFALAVGYVSFELISSFAASNSLPYISRWFTDVRERPALTNTRVQCPNAPFILPSEGLIGLLWDDAAAPYNLLATHTGLDIFGDGDSGAVPVYAVYPGYLTRNPEWLSTVIIRHDDPLQAGRTIWTYYTHMGDESGVDSYVDAAFPPGTREQFVEQGTLLGYQGLYSPNRPIGLHLHFSIVLGDGASGFLNEARTNNTLDPSPYFGMALGSRARPERPVRCSAG
jgi:peptidoglycan LD-endopeptidase LytH